MRILLDLCSAASAACMIILAAGELGITPRVAVFGKLDGRVASKTEVGSAPRTSVANTVTFNGNTAPEIVKNFDIDL